VSPREWYITHQADADAAIDPCYYYRVLANGNACILDSEGYAVTTLPVDNIYPVGSQLSVRYEHTGGIVLSVADAVRLNISPE